MGNLKLYPTNIRIKGAFINMHIIAKDKKEAIAICKEINSELKITANQVEQMKTWLADPRNKWGWDINA